MRTSLIRLATSSAPLPLTLTQASAQLVPPIPLYRRLLRSHRNLPIEMRYLGDSYVKSEFRLTRSTDNPLHIIAFLSQWKMYLDELENATEVIDVDNNNNNNNNGIDTSGKGKKKQVVNFRGRKLEPEVLDKFSPEQLGQLYELMHATKDVWKTPEELEAGATSAEHDDSDSESNISSSPQGKAGDTTGDGDGNRTR